MKVFVAGATGAIGSRLVPLLAASGHEVVGLTRSAERASFVRALGAEPVVADGLDRDAVVDAVVRSEPEVVIHQMTGLAGVADFRNLDAALERTNRLRTEGMTHLLEAARAARARRVIVQSYGLWHYAGADGRLATEADPVDPNPPTAATRTVEAVRHAESAVTGASDLEGLALRYGMFYGPGTGIADDGLFVEAVRARHFPVVGAGSGVWSFVHVDDAASATAAAIDRGAPGVYNVADDDPAPVAVWLPELTEIVGAKPPLHIPEWLGRRIAGESGVYQHNRVDGLSNEKARRELAWEPRFRTWREGFRNGLSDATPEAARAA